MRKLMIWHRKTARKNALLAAGIMSLAASLAPTQLLADPDPACDPVFNAVTKLLQTPNHQFMSQSSASDGVTSGGKVQTGETISTGDASYVKFNNAWRKAPITPSEMLKHQEEGRHTAKESCSFIKDDDGEGGAKLYKAHTETPKGVSDVQIWISPSTGLPVREEVDLAVQDGGRSAKTHSSIRFDYENVKVPDGAK